MLTISVFVLPHGVVLVDPSRHFTTLALTSYALERNVPRMLSLIQEIMCETLFTDKERLATLVTQVSVSSPLFIVYLVVNTCFVVYQ